MEPNRTKQPNILRDLADCTCCPRECHANRIKGKLGYCRSGVGFPIGSICAHRGEEPVISGPHGICNIFFTHCNMQCIYCQNYDISRNRGAIVEHEMTLEELVDQIESFLRTGCPSVGFVSPSHVVPQVRAIIHAVKERGFSPVFLYNTNGYDKKETIRALAGEIDVYLPDMKYMDARLAKEYSDTPDYPDIATQALKEMYRQMGADIELDENGLITRGMIIRHLVLPGHVENSKAVLRFIAEELSPDMYISLMSQYYPTPAVRNHPKLGRYLTAEEYEEVLDEFERLGFHRGFVQELSSPDHYKPDFMKDHPFE